MRKPKKILKPLFEGEEVVKLCKMAYIRGFDVGSNISSSYLNGSNSSYKDFEKEHLYIDKPK